MHFRGSGEKGVMYGQANQASDIPIAAIGAANASARARPQMSRLSASPSNPPAAKPTQIISPVETPKAMFPYRFAGSLGRIHPPQAPQQRRPL